VIDQPGDEQEWHHQEEQNHHESLEAQLACKKNNTQIVKRK